MPSLRALARAAARALIPVCLVGALSPASSAQWDFMPHDPAFPVLEEGFIVIHPNTTGVHAFSAAARKWTTVSPAGSALVGSGDWTMLTREGPATYRGYSARRNDSAAIGVANTILTLTHDDVALVIESGPLGLFAHAYSAVYNGWSTIPLTVLPGIGDVTISRFVIAIRDGDAYHGFAARTGAWSSLTLPTRGDVPTSDGNTVLVDLTDPVTGVGTPAMAAFSGVRGSWAISPPYDFPNAAMLDHNVAYTRIRPAVPGMTAGCAYTAYDAVWVPSTVLHDPALITETISDNVVRIEDLDPALRFEAFGARPATWATLAGPFASILHDEDYTIVRRTSNAEIWGYSGVCGGVWTPEPTPSGALSVPVGAPDHQVALLEGPSRLHTFLPSMNSWAPVFVVPPGAVITGEDALTDVRAGTLDGNATRWGGWTAGRPTPVAPFATVSGGAVIAHQQLGGAGVGDIYVFDERCDMWSPAFNPGLVTTLTPGRNLLVSTAPGPGTPVHGYSVQRGDWTSPGPIATPLVLGPTTEENVAWLVDGTGRLWGFGSPNVGHVYYAWPNGTEYHVSGAPAGAVVIPILGYSVLGIPFTTGAFALISSGKVPPIPLPPITGFLCLDLTWFVNLGFLGVTDADCLRERLFKVPNPVGNCLQFWLQPLSYNFTTTISTWEHRCDPAWFF